MTDFRIYIPTKGRGPGAQRTWGNLPPTLHQHASIVVPIQERKDWRDWPGQVLHPPLSVRGIGATRQWIIDSSKADVAIMMDDDLSFAYRPDPDVPATLVPSGPEQVLAMVAVLCHWHANGFIHCGSALRGGSNRVEGAYRDGCRMTRVMSYDPARMRDLNIRFDRVPVMEDFDCILQLLRLGYPNRVSYTYVNDQPASQAAGGCSTYRTMEVQAEAANRLAQLHPGLVRVVQKKAKGGGEWATRTDVVVQWRKALAQGREKEKERVAPAVGTTTFDDKEEELGCEETTVGEPIRHEGTGLSYRPGTWDMEVIKEQRRAYDALNLTEHDTVLDMGGNIGAFALVAAGHCRMVSSYEPEPDNFDLLKSNIKATPFVATQAAITQSGGSVDLYINSKANKGSHTTRPTRGRESISVDAVPFYEVLQGRPYTAIKCDIEGGEYGLDWGTVDSFITVKRLAIELHLQAPNYREAAVALVAKLEAAGWVTQEPAPKLDGGHWHQLWVGHR